MLVLNLLKPLGSFLAHPSLKPVKSIAQRYSAQASLATLIVIFLTLSVGEGQAYNLASANTISSLSGPQEGFIGKPQLFLGQTVLTGEVQQSVAIIYHVEQGDTILGVAKRYDLSVGTILDANNLDAAEADKIKPGTELIVPAQDTNTSLAWLDKINKIKEEERRKAESERQRQLALQNRNRRASSSNSRSYSSYSGDYSIIGTLRGLYNGGYPGQCTWYANYKRPNLPNGMGNGGQYLASARAKGLATSNNPRPGSLFVSTESRWGHTGYVEVVNGNLMTVSEMNYVGPYVVSRRTIPIHASFIKGFIL